MLLRVDVRGAVFLGCRFAEPGTWPGATSRNVCGPAAPCFPGAARRALRPLPAAALLPRRAVRRPGRVHFRAGPAPVRRSPDATIYAWARTSAGRTLTGDLAATLHDHSVDGALDDVTDRLDPTRVVGVMGGHALLRSDPAYAATARLGAGLTRAGRTVLTGGGPGAMEAANLGAYLSGWDDALPAALRSSPGRPTTSTAWTPGRPRPSPCATAGGATGSGRA